MNKSEGNTGFLIAGGANPTFQKCTGNRHKTKNCFLGQGSVGPPMQTKLSTCTQVKI